MKMRKALNLHMCFEARNTMSTAFKSGKLKRPQACSKCATVGKVIGHHDDYAKPLEVRFLCQKCHNDWHYKPV